MDAGDVVAGHEIAHDGIDVAADFRCSGVHVEHSADAVGVIGKTAADVACGARVGDIGGGAVGVYPCVDFEAALAGFADEKSQRIVAGRLALCAGEKSAPRLKRRGIEGIALGSHLKEDGIQAGAFGRIEKAHGLGFLLLHAQTLFRGEIDVVNGGNPSALHFGAGD